MRIDHCLLTIIGRRILLNNLNNRELNKPYVFPENVNFDQIVELNFFDPIDRCIIKEID